MRALDCQGLAGAYTLGTVRAGFDLVAKLELPGGFGMDNCLANRHLLGDFDDHVGTWQEWPQYDDIQYVFGNPPCSGFSLLNTSKNAAARGPDSTINDCMWAFVEYAARLPGPPEFLSFESVQQAFSNGRSLMTRLIEKLNAVTGANYRLTHVKMSGASVGAAALRRRYFWVAHRVPFGVEVEDRERPGTYRDAIFDLKGLNPYTWQDQRVRRKPTPWLKEWDMRRSDGKVDAHIGLNEETTKATSLRRWIAVLPWWEQGDIFENAVKKAHAELGYVPGPWEEQPDVETHRFGFQQPKRVKWDQVGYVVTGAGPYQYLHPDEDRWLTIRELARLQGFPDTWTFDAAEKVARAGAWIGKGVPVQSGQWLSTWVRNSLNGQPGTITGEEIDDNEYLIDVTNTWKSWSGKT